MATGPTGESERRSDSPPVRIAVTPATSGRAWKVDRPLVTMVRSTAPVTSCASRLIVVDESIAITPARGTRGRSLPAMTAFCSECERSRRTKLSGPL